MKFNTNYWNNIPEIDCISIQKSLYYIIYIFCFSFVHASKQNNNIYLYCEFIKINYSFRYHVTQINSYLKKRCTVKFSLNKSPRNKYPGNIVQVLKYWTLLQFIVLPTFYNFLYTWKCYYIPFYFILIS